MECEFSKNEISFLGHVINSDGIKMEPSKVDAVVKWPQPKNIHDIRSFLGLAGYYRRFVKDFSKLASPLANLLHKNIPFKWAAAVLIMLSMSVMLVRHGTVVSGYVKVSQKKYC